MNCGGLAGSCRKTVICVGTTWWHCNVGGHNGLDQMLQCPDVAESFACLQEGKLCLSVKQEPSLLLHTWVGRYMLLPVTFSHVFSQSTSNPGKRDDEMGERKV